MKQKKLKKGNIMDVSVRPHGYETLMPTLQKKKKDENTTIKEVIKRNENLPSTVYVKEVAK